MKTQHTDTHAYLLDSDIEVWIEPDVYCPRLIIRRPKKIKSSYSVLSQTMDEFKQIISSKESIFIEDPIYNFLANPEFSNMDKLNTAKQLRKLAEKMERMVNEKIEEESEDESLWYDNENP